jgi:hypothetical protein
MATKEATTTAPEQIVPVLLADHKLKLLLAQRDVMSARILFDKTQRDYMDKLNATNAVAAEIVKELGIDPTAFTLDMDALALVPNK